MRALLICNQIDDDAGFIGARFEHHGYRFEVSYREDHPAWPSLDGIDQLLLLGSDWSLYWEHLTEHTEREADLVRRAASGGIPTFGICYGGQMIAHALGGTVRRAEVAEVGWYEIDSDVEQIERGPWMEWHYDQFTVPPTATELARSPLAPQAFVQGRTLGLQFHPEVDRSIVARWAEGGGAAELAKMGVDLDDLLARCEVESRRSETSAGRLVDWYLDAVVGAVRD